MEKRLVFRGMEHSAAIENYVQDKLAKLEKLLLAEEREPIRVEVILTAHRNHHHHTAEIHLTAANLSLTVQRENPELYLAVDQVVDIMWDDVQKARKKQVDARKEDHQFRVIK
ncbi:MAG TPA: HPF/RaiA family ribosome-associated protein [Candidatus Babeliales bacterium]|nr:HPF/RaiA family ribosome-associated protein [Candidatus Babeliales bacterium]